ncbi:hypothetical protein N7G274_003346 [Stereocaulon virgatum]|uniref:Uncharacterized protein n=1 Tax=Stereocaulon virgatum TaxID=373712 RepID=A0ABR4AEC9_9LECA
MLCTLIIAFCAFAPAAIATITHHTTSTSSAASKSTPSLHLSSMGLTSRATTAAAASPVVSSSLANRQTPLSTLTTLAKPSAGAIASSSYSSSGLSSSAKLAISLSVPVGILSLVIVTVGFYWGFKYRHEAAMRAMHQEEEEPFQGFPGDKDPELLYEQGWHPPAIGYL